MILTSAVVFPAQGPPVSTIRFIMTKKSPPPESERDYYLTLLLYSATGQYKITQLLESPPQLQVPLLAALLDPPKQKVQAGYLQQQLQES